MSGQVNGVTVTGPTSKGRLDTILKADLDEEEMKRLGSFGGRSIYAHYAW